MDEIKDHDLYTKGFNKGYEMDISDNRVMSKLLEDIEINDDYINGLKGGMSQMNLEVKQVQREETAQLVESEEYKRNYDQIVSEYNEDMRLEKEYEEGFNHGYFLQKEEPELLDMVLNFQGLNGTYEAGMQDGKDQYVKDLALQKDMGQIDRALDDLKKDDINPDLDNDLDRDLDIEKD